MASRIESETIISYNLKERVAYICTNIQRDKNRMKELEVDPEKVEDDVEFYEIPMNWIKINPPRKLTEEHKKALQKRGKELVERNKFRKKENKSV